MTEVVFCSKRDNCAHAVTAERGEGLQIRLIPAPPPESEVAIVRHRDTHGARKLASARWRS